VPAPLVVLLPTVPDADQLAAIRALVDAVARVDGRDPLSDQALTQLSSSDVQHAIAKDDDGVVGYAQRDGDSLEIAAASPSAARALLHNFRNQPVRIWSHGRGSRLIPVLESSGFGRTRELHQLRRSLSDPVEVPAVPVGIRIAEFRVGVDEDAWLDVNSAAFVEHPEQGAWTRADLEAREREPWFDPSGFLMAWRDAELAGFHWTKVHPAGVGEVYVIAVAPSAQGTGLGAVLLLRGLALLQARGCTEVMLYVDGYNTGAMRLYERYGFTPHDLDIQWSAG
jgi:mycothiol synthase